MQVVVIRPNLDDVRVDGLFTIAETIVGLCTEFGEKRREVLRAGNGEVGGA